MKKIIAILISSLLITGCTVNYDLEVSGNILKEELEIPLYKDKDKILKEVNDAFPIADDFYNKYNYKVEESSDKVKLSFNYKKNFKSSMVARTCFEEFSFNETDTSISIKAGKHFGCLYDAKKVKINITTNNYVQFSNADNVNDNTYTWIIDSTNRSDTDLEIMINKKIKYEKSKSNILKNIFKISMIIFLIAGSIYLYFDLTKNKEQNN